MSTRRKIIITILMVILLIAPILFYLFFRSEEPTAPSREDMDRPVSIPLIPERVKEQNYEVNFNVNENEFNFPNTINLISYQPKTLNESEIEQIARNLSFNGEPEIAKDYLYGELISFSDDRRYISANPNIGELTYNLKQIPSPTNSLSEEQIINIAENFLIENEFTGSENNFVSSVNYLQRSELSDRLETATVNSAEVYQVNFSSNISEIPILTLDPNKTLTYVRVVSDGTILSAKTSILESIETTQQRNLKTYQEVIDTIDNAKIASVDNGLMFNETIPRNVISSIEIEEIKLAYLQISNTANTIQPIFLLKGTAKIRQRPQPLPIILYLPAISGN